MTKKTRNETGAAKRESGGDFDLLLIALAACLLAAACSPLQRHAALDFVFDGVPPYMTPEERASQEAEALESAGQEEAFSRRGSRTARQRKLSRFVHGPYAAKECERCHDLGAASGFRGPGGGGATSAASTGDLAEAGRLRMPLGQLCIHCHTDFAADDASNVGLWMHGPVANGLCVTCHQSHSSSYPALVSADPPARLCGLCHRREDLVTFTPEHLPVDPEDGYPPPAPPSEEPGEETGAAGRPLPPVVRVVADCTRCHDPHRGPERSILKARNQWGPEPVRELKPAPEFVPDPESTPEAGPEHSGAPVSP